MTFSIFGALGEYERSLIIERIRSGIARAKMQGRKFGRPRLYDDEVRARVVELRASGLTVREIAQTVGLGSGLIARARR
jgi:DNA invertase Pin-like site-specific DNA recombinase